MCHSHHCCQTCRRRHLCTHQHITDTDSRKWQLSDTRIQGQHWPSIMLPLNNLYRKWPPLISTNISNAQKKEIYLQFYTCTCNIQKHAKCKFSHFHTTVNNFRLLDQWSCSDMISCQYSLSLVTWLVSFICTHSAIFVGMLFKQISGSIICYYVNMWMETTTSTLCQKMW